MDNEKKLMTLVIEFRDGIRKVIKNVEDFDFDNETFLRVSIKDRSYYMYVAYVSIKCLEVIDD